MSVIICGQADVLADECPECGGWLHRAQRGGFPGQGMAYCAEDCVAAAQERTRRRAVEAHLYVRDLLCNCEVCAPRGLPTAEQRVEWAAYLTHATAPGGPDA